MQWSIVEGRGRGGGLRVMELRRCRNGVFEHGGCGLVNGLVLVAVSKKGFECSMELPITNAAETR